MRVFVVAHSRNPRVEYDSSKDEFVERHEQSFLLTSDTEEEHNAILDLIKKCTTIDDEKETKPC